jgi:hypothetical protein
MPWVATQGSTQSHRAISACPATAPSAVGRCAVGPPRRQAGGMGLWGGGGVAVGPAGLEDEAKAEAKSELPTVAEELRRARVAGSYTNSIVSSVY